MASPRRRRSRCSRPARTASWRRARTSAPAAAAGSRTTPTTSSSRRRKRRSATRSPGSAGSRIRRSSRSCPPPRSTATATSSSTRSRRPTDGPALGFHRAGRWDEVLPIEVCLLTTDLGNAIRDAVQAWAREEKLEAYDQATQNGYLRHLVLREGRNTGQVLVQLVTGEGQEVRGGLPDRGAAPLPRGAVDPLGDQRHAGRGDEPPDGAALGRGRDRGGDPRAALPRAAERVPPDEHRDGRDAVLDRARLRRADAAARRSTTSTAAPARSGSRSPRRRSPSGASRSRRSRSPARSRTPS